MPRQAVLEDDQCEPCSAQDVTGDISESFDARIPPCNMGLTTGCMSPDAMERPRVTPGMCIRVWRWTSFTPRMEWSEVIRSTTVAGNEWLLCETLLFELFEFSPQLVAQGIDEAVEAYEIAYEDSEKVNWRQQEVARLHDALSEQGRLGHLPPPLAYPSPGFIVAPSQFHVKVTVLGSVAPERRRDLQESVQQKLLLNLSRCQVQSACGCINGIDRGSVERPTATVANTGQDVQSPWQRWLQTVRSHFQTRASTKLHSCKAGETLEIARTSATRSDPETSVRHIPELCSECIRLGSWCSGLLHLPGVTSCLDVATATMDSSVHWSPCEAGVESEVDLIMPPPCPFLCMPRA